MLLQQLVFYFHVLTTMGDQTHIKRLFNVYILVLWKCKNKLRYFHSCTVNRDIIKVFLFHQWTHNIFVY